jgi:diadenosine tetraphosphate (Ap4A) HIT family hydrolase
MDDTATACVFCRIVRRELTPGVIAYRDSQTAVFPSRDQQRSNRGHMLVVPTRHVAQIYDLDRDVAGPLMTTLARVATAVRAARTGEDAVRGARKDYVAGFWREALEK